MVLLVTVSAWRQTQRRRRRGVLVLALLELCNRGDGVLRAARPQNLWVEIFEYREMAKEEVRTTTLRSGPFQHLVPCL